MAPAPCLGVGGSSTSSTLAARSAVWPAAATCAAQRSAAWMDLSCGSGVERSGVEWQATQCKQSGLAGAASAHTQRSRGRWAGRAGVTKLQHAPDTRPTSSPGVQGRWLVCTAPPPQPGTARPPPAPHRRTRTPRLRAVRQGWRVLSGGGGHGAFILPATLCACGSTARQCRRVPCRLPSCAPRPLQPTRCWHAHVMMRPQPFAAWDPRCPPCYTPRTHPAAPQHPPTFLHPAHPPCCTTLRPDPGHPPRCACSSPTCSMGS